MSYKYYKPARKKIKYMYSQSMIQRMKTFVPQKQVAFKNKKYLRYELSKFYITQKDIYGRALMQKEIWQPFKYIYYSIYIKSFRRPWNIFAKLDHKFLRSRAYSTYLRDGSIDTYYRQKMFLRFYRTVKYKQMRKIYMESKRKKKYVIDHFIFCLEMRLDYSLYRMLQGVSLSYVRQLIQHRGIYVNSIKVDKISYRLKPFEIIHINLKDKNGLNPVYVYLKTRKLRFNRQFFLHKYPKYIEFHYGFLVGTVHSFFKYADVPYHHEKIMPGEILSIFRV